MLSVRLSPKQESALEQLSEETGRSKSYYVKQALDAKLAILALIIDHRPSTKCQRLPSFSDSRPKLTGSSHFGSENALACCYT